MQLRVKLTKKCADVVTSLSYCRSASVKALLSHIGTPISQMRTQSRVQTAKPCADVSRGMWCP